MFAEKLSLLLRKLVHAQPQYITATLHNGEAAEKMLPPQKLPRHVAIIMDGNGRWAKKRGLPRAAGHAAGTEALRDIIRASDDWGIESLSLYAFSTENWARSKEEVNSLMGLLIKYFNSEIDELDEKNVRIRILGDIAGLPDPQREAVTRAMERTKNNDGLNLNIALNYGGRAELVRAAKALGEKVAAGELSCDAITEEDFEQELYTAGQPDVDLLIRTSGEMRTSNFLPWQTAYAEFVFDPIYWPDYDRATYLKDLREFAGRDRRYGAEEAAPDADANANADADTAQEAQE